MNLPLEPRLIQRARRSHPLTREQKLLNRLRSTTRIKVEHTLSRRKKYAIAHSIYRNPDEDYDSIMMQILEKLVSKKDEPDFKSFKVRFIFFTLNSF